MDNFHYTVSQGDNLFKIFTNKADENGYVKDSSAKTNINSVSKAFEDVNTEEQTNDGTKLYQGGSERGNWQKNFVILVNQVIDLTSAQLEKIYTAMGYKKKEGVNEGVNEQPTTNSVSNPNTASVEQAQLKEKINSVEGTPTVNDVEPTQEMKENIEKTRDALSNALKNLSQEDLDRIGISAEKRDRMLVYLENITYDSTHDSAQAKGTGIVFSTNMELEQTADVANVMTLLMHEANHCDENFLKQYPEYSNENDLRHRDKDGNPVQKCLVNTLEEERSCETIALLTTAILIKNRTIKGQDNYGRYGDIGVDKHPVTTYLTNPDLLHKDVENWLSGYTNYPDSIANPSIKIEHMQENDKLKLSDTAKAEKPLQLLAGDEIRVDGKTIHTISGSDANGVVLSAFDSIPLFQMTQGGDVSKQLAGMIMFDSLQPSEEELNYWKAQNNNDNYAHDIKAQLDEGQVVEIYRNGKPIYTGKMINS